MKRYSEIQESLFSDVVARGEGRSVRKEDDVNLLNVNDFYQYLQEHYEIDTFKFDRILGGIKVPIMRSKTGGFDMLTIKYFSTDIFKVREISTSLSGEECKHAFKDTYKSKYDIVYSYNGLSYFKIFPKDKSVQLSNSFFLEILDTIIKNEDNSLIKKIK